MGIGRFQRLSIWAQKKTDSSPVQLVASATAGIGSALGFRYLSTVVMASAQISDELQEEAAPWITAVSSLILVIGMVYTKRNLYSDVEEEVKVLGARQKSQAKRILDQEDTVFGLTGCFSETQIRIERSGGPVANDLTELFHETPGRDEEEKLPPEEKNPVALGRCGRLNDWLSQTSATQWLISTGLGTGFAASYYFLIKVIISQLPIDDTMQQNLEIANYATTGLAEFVGILFAVNRYQRFSEWLHETSDSTTTQWMASIGAGFNTASGWHFAFALITSYIELDEKTRLSLIITNYITASLVGIGSMLFTKRNLYSDIRNRLGQLQPRVEDNTSRIKRIEKIIKKLITILYKIADAQQPTAREALKEEISTIISDDIAIAIDEEKEEKSALVSDNQEHDSINEYTYRELFRHYATSPFAAPAQTLASIGIGAGFASAFYYIADLIASNVNSSLASQIKVANYVITAVIFLVSARDAQKNLFTSRYDKTVRNLQPSLDNDSSQIDKHCETLIKLVDVLKSVINSMPGDNKDLIERIETLFHWEKSPSPINVNDLSPVNDRGDVKDSGVIELETASLISGKNDSEAPNEEHKSLGFGRRN